ncbi:MAG TPA: hypothetical protein VNR36_08160 [Pseudolysinimonas sp.]|nr:hypothetical protein [Pseudolysinimonas sp.]
MSAPEPRPERDFRQPEKKKPRKGLAVGLGAGAAGIALAAGAALGINTDIDLPSFAPAGPPTRREIENGDTLIVRLAERELRSEEMGTIIESDLVLMVQPEHVGPVVVRWEATSSNIDGVSRGSFTVPTSDKTLDLFRAGIEVDVERHRRE